MLALERQHLVLNSLDSNQWITIHDLALKLNVSEMTIRRDIQKLSSEHSILISQGSILLGKHHRFVSKEIPYEEKSQLNRQIKIKLAQKASELISDGETILLGSGTTNLELASLLLARKLTVITADLSIANRLSQSLTVETILTGGQVDSISHACVGTMVENFLKDLYVDKVFLGCMAWDVDAGVTSASIVKARMKKIMLQCGKKKILISDYSKFGRRSLSTICKLDEFDWIISNDQFHKNQKSKLRPFKKKLLLVDHL